MNLKTKEQMSELELSVMKMIHKDVRHYPDDDKWRNYSRSFKFENRDYKVTCQFKVSNQYLTHKKLAISYDTQIVQINQGTYQ
jgi:hypothetical protein